MQKVRIYCRLDVTIRVAPQALVGRKLRVYWPDDDGWYLGTVVLFDPQTGQHKVLLPPCMHYPLDVITVLGHAALASSCYLNAYLIMLLISTKSNTTSTNAS